MTTPIIASMGGLSFAIDNSSPHTLGNMQGWYSGAPKRVVVEEYPNSDGASEVDRDFRGARVITCTGLLTSVSTDSAITDVWSAFAALQADGVPSPFTVSDALGTLSVNASVAINDINPLLDGLAEYVLQVVARDPVKYSAASTLTTGLPMAGGGLRYPLHDPSGKLDYGANGTLGRVTLTNAGTATVWPTVTVTGQLTAGFYIQRLDTAQVVRYDRVVPAGSTVFVDFRTGEVLIDGLSDGSTYLTRSEFFAVPPMSSVEVQFNEIGGHTGSPTAEFTNRNGFW